jgi:hypothetical protein
VKQEPPLLRKGREDSAAVAAVDDAARGTAEAIVRR